MKIYVATCDHYAHLLPGFARQFNKYWSPEQEVTILGFSAPSGLPENFKFHQMEPVETLAWTANLRNFFSSIDDHHFLFLLDDYWLTEPIDLAAVEMLEQEVINGAVKGDLSTNTYHFDHWRRPDGKYVAQPHAHYRTSTQPCIWERHYMLRLLAQDLNPWQFELQNSPAIKDGLIVGTDHQIYKFANVYFKGEPHHMISQISPEDRSELWAIGAFAGMPEHPHVIK